MCYRSLFESFNLPLSTELQSWLAISLEQSTRLLWRVFSAKINYRILFFNKCILYSSNSFCIISFAFSIVLSRLLVSKTHFVLAVLHFNSLHTAFCFDTFHCDDVIFFVTLRTQNLHDNYHCEVCTAFNTNSTRIQHDVQHDIQKRPTLISII